MHARNADCSGVRLSWEMGLNISAISSATAKRWIKNDEDDFDIGVKNGIEHSPGELLWLCSRAVYTLNITILASKIKSISCFYSHNNYK